VDAARCELAAAFLEDLRGIDARMRETRKKLTVAVQAAGTSLTGLFGVGPVIAAVVGDVGDVSRFPGRDQFAAYNGTAPIEVSFGQRKVYRLSRRGTVGSTTPSTWPRRWWLLEHSRPAGPSCLMADRCRPCLGCGARTLSVFDRRRSLPLLS
jgi:hypothetical protein